MLFKQKSKEGTFNFIETLPSKPLTSYQRRLFERTYITLKHIPTSKIFAGAGNTLDFTTTPIYVYDLTIKHKHGMRLFADSYTERFVLNDSQTPEIYIGILLQDLVESAFIHLLSLDPIHRDKIQSIMQKHCPSHVVGEHQLLHYYKNRYDILNRIFGAKALNELFTIYELGNDLFI